MKDESAKAVEHLREVVRIADWDQQLSVDELRYRAALMLRRWREERDARTPIPQPGQPA